MPSRDSSSEDSVASCGFDESSWVVTAVCWDESAVACVLVAAVCVWLFSLALALARDVAPSVTDAWVGCAAPSCVVFSLAATSDVFEEVTAWPVEVMAGSKANAATGVASAAETISDAAAP